MGGAYIQFKGNQEENPVGKTCDWVDHLSKKKQSTAPPTMMETRQMKNSSDVKIKNTLINIIYSSFAYYDFSFSSTLCLVSITTVWGQWDQPQ